MFKQLYLLLALAISSDALASQITFEEQEMQHWQIINDTVMGGRSKSRFYQHDGNGVFEGYLSLENYGGFASVRRYMTPNLFTNGMVQLRIKGDGRKYQLRLTTPQLYRGMAYVAEFQTTKNQWQQVNFYQQDFTVKYRGRLVTNAPLLNFADVSGIGFLLGNKQAGDFRLEVQSILALEENNYAI